MTRLSAISIRHKRTAVSVRSLAVSTALAALLILAPGAKANNTFFYDTGNVCTNANPCWQAGMFGLLVGLGSSVGQSAYLTEAGAPAPNDNIRGTSGSGDVGIGAGSFINTSPGNAGQNWAGPVDFADPCSGTCATSHTFSVPSATDNLTNVTLTGGTTVGNSSVTTALNQLLSISNYWKGASGEIQLGSGTGAFTGGTTIGTIGAGIQVFSVNSLNLTSVLTIKGNTQDLIIINDPSTAIFTKAISLTGGISSDQVLFNIYGTVGNILTINAGSAQINADIIARSTWNAQAATINGRLLGGYGTLLMGKNFEVTDPADVATFVPEPGEWALMAGGVGALFYLGRKLPRRGGLRMSNRVLAGIEAEAAKPAHTEAIPDPPITLLSSGADPPRQDSGVPPPRAGGGSGGLS